MDRSGILDDLKTLKKHHEAELKRLDKAIEALSVAMPAPRAKRDTLPPSTDRKPPITWEIISSALPPEPANAEYVADKIGYDLSIVRRELNFNHSYGRLVRTGKKGSYLYARKENTEATSPSGGGQ